MRIVSESEFNERIRHSLRFIRWGLFDYVVGPGRSGAIAAVYASHIMGIPFLPYGSKLPGKRALVIDTATESGKTLRKAFRKYSDCNPVALAVYSEPPRVAFWYEAVKPQRYCHERRAA